MNIWKFLFIFLIYTISCIKNSDGPDIGQYYEQDYIDQIIVISQEDSIHIIVEQLPAISSFNENILVSIENDTSLIDTIKLELKVKYGSYSSEPHPQKELIIEDAIIYLWYASGKRPEPVQLKKVKSEQTISKITTRPKDEYYNIESIIIKKSNLKNITYEILFYR